MNALEIDTRSKYILPVKSPLAAEDFNDGVMVHIRMNTVDQVIRGHDRPGRSLANCNLKRTQVKLTQSTLRHNGVDVIAFRFLLIGNKVCFNMVSNRAKIDTNPESRGQTYA